MKSLFPAYSIYGRLKGRSKGSADWRNGYCVFWKGGVQNVFNGMQSMFKGLGTSSLADRFLIKKNDSTWVDQRGLGGLYGPLVAPQCFLATHEVPGGPTSSVKWCFPLRYMIIVFGDFYSSRPRSMVFEKSTETTGT